VLSLLKPQLHQLSTEDYNILDVSIITISLKKHKLLLIKFNFSFDMLNKVL